MSFREFLGISEEKISIDHNEDVQNQAQGGTKNMEESVYTSQDSDKCEANNMYLAILCISLLPFGIVK